MKNKLIRFFTRQAIKKQNTLNSSAEVLDKLNSAQGDQYAMTTMAVFFVLGLVSLAGLALVFTWLGITVLQLAGAILCWFFIVILIRLVLLLLS